jgi:hypothetical protein
VGGGVEKRKKERKEEEKTIHSHPLDKLAR